MKPKLMHIVLPFVKQKLLFVKMPLKEVKLV